MSSLRTAAILFLLQAGTFGLQQAGSKASVEGIVLRASDGEPLSNAQVKLTPVMPEDDSGFFIVNGNEVTVQPAVFTQADGKFAFKDIDPGAYNLTVSRNGYASQSYRQIFATAGGAVIHVVAGEALKNIEFRMIQGGVVTGRVRTGAGEPVAALSVELIRLGYSTDGRKTLETYDSAQTDDRGEYRFFWTAPGRYLVRVARNRYQNGPRTFVSDRPVSITYYPGVLDTSQATAVEVLAGTEIGGIDIVLPLPSGHRIRGRVVDASTGKPPRVANIGLRSRSGAFLEYNEYTETEYNPFTGAFEIRNVSSGSYWLSASVQSDFEAPLSEGALANVRTGIDVFETVFAARATVQMAIDMPPSDLNDVVLALKQGVAIPVQIAIEGQPFSIEKGLDSVRVAVSPSGDYFFGGRQSTRPSAEGVTRIDNVVPGEYRVSIGFGKANEFYAKDVRYGRTDALNDPIQVTEQTPSAITVLLSSKGGQIEGILRDALLQPVSGFEVLLIPDRRDNRELYKKVRTDHDGRFLFRSLSPGDYKVFSWEALEPNAYYDAEVLTQYEALGKSVHVRESAKETIEAKLIPLRKP